MKTSFVLNNSRAIFDEIIEMESFKRYDMTDINVWFKNEFNEFKSIYNREPFIYEILDLILKPVNKVLQNDIKQVLFKKNYDWFLNIGQYFFYNLYQWVQKFQFHNGNNKDSFLESWWKIFLEYENQQNEENILNKSIPEYPEKILLELTNNCNLNCIMCGVGKKGYDPFGNLSLALLEHLCKKVLSRASLIRLNGLGESTIIPNFLDYLDLICELPVKLEIVTNLTVQNKKIWNTLIEKQTNFLISCDSFNPKNFELIRRGSNFEAFKKNLEYIGKNVANPLQAQIIFTLMEQNINDLLGVINMTANYGLGGVIVNVVKQDSEDLAWLEREFDNILNVFQKSYEISKERGINLKLPDHLGTKQINSRISNLSCSVKCDNPWNEIYIRYNGDLTVCNMLNPYIYGNCRNCSFDQIWDGLNAYMFRSFVNTEYRHYYCRECYYLI